MADTLGIGRYCQKRKNRRDADDLEDSLRKGKRKNQSQFRSAVWTGQEENAPDQIGRVLEEPRQGEIEQDQQLVFVGNCCKRPKKFRCESGWGDQCVTARSRAKTARPTPWASPVIALGASGFDKVLSGNAH